MRGAQSAMVLAVVAIATAYAGVVVEHSVQSSLAFSHRAGLSMRASKASLPVQVTASDPLTPAQVDFMIELAKRDDLYRVRVTGSGLPSSPVASVRACQLAASGLRTELQLILSQRSLAEAQDAVSELVAVEEESGEVVDAGAEAALLSPEVVGVDLRVPLSSVGCAQTADGRAKQMEAALTALWTVQKTKGKASADVGPVLPLRAKVLLPGGAEQLPLALQSRGQPHPGMGRSEVVGPDGEKKEDPDAPKSFWQQYGGYITPILVVYAVMTLFAGGGGGGEGEGQAQGSGGGGGGGE